MQAPDELSLTRLHDDISVMPSLDETSCDSSDENDVSISSPQVRSRSCRPVERSAERRGKRRRRRRIGSPTGRQTAIARTLGCSRSAAVWCEIDLSMRSHGGESSEYCGDASSASSRVRDVLRRRKNGGATQLKERRHGTGRARAHTRNSQRGGGRRQAFPRPMSGIRPAQRRAVARGAR